MGIAVMRIISVGHDSLKLLIAWRRIFLFPTMNIIGHTSDWVAANIKVGPHKVVGFSGINTNITTVRTKHVVTADTDFRLMMLVLSLKIYKIYSIY